MTKQRGLGKGLGALLGEAALQTAEPPSGAQLLPLQKVEPNPLQPRKNFDPDELQALADSIAMHGVIQPLTVRQLPSGFYQIIAGERRWRAARMAELEEIPAIVRDVETIQRMEMALIENIQRTDLNPLEEAQAVSSLMQECGLTQEQIAQRIGKSRSAVANLLRLLNLPKEVAELVAEGELSEGHARAILGAEDPEMMISLANQAVQRGLNVRQTEALAKAVKEQREEGEKQKEEKPRCAELTLVEEAARRRFGTKISIVGNEKRGKLILHYNSPEDLERIYEFIRIQDD